MQPPCPDSQQLEAVIAGEYETRLCSRCRKQLPITEFRFHRKATGERHTICRLCFNAYCREHRLQLRHKEIHTFTVMAHDAYRHQGARDLTALLADMIRRFNGLQRFAACWKQVIDEAVTKKKYSAALRSFNVLNQLFMASSELQREEAEERQQIFGGLSLDEMEQAQAAALARLIQAKPEIAIRAAASLGWEIRPPGSEEVVRP